MAEAKGQAKMIFKKLSDQSEPRCTIESGTFTFQQLVSFRSNTLSYLIENAFSYLEELAKEFDVSYGQEVMKPGLRPYAFIKFDTFIQKTKRLYQDTRTQHNLSKLNEDLQDVTRIMTKNMEDLLWRGDSLDRMSTLSDNLRGESLKYKREARNLNLQALYRKYGLPAIVLLGVFLVLYLRYYAF